MSGTRMLTVGAFEVEHETQVKRLVWETGSEIRKTCEQVPQTPFWLWKDGSALQET